MTPVLHTCLGDADRVHAGNSECSIPELTVPVSASSAVELNVCRYLLPRLEGNARSNINQVIQRRK